MRPTEPPRAARRRASSTVLLLVGAVAAVAAVLVLLGQQSLSGSLPSVASPFTTERAQHVAPGHLPRERRGGIGEADGVVPDGVTVFDDEYAAVARLDPALLAALRAAAADAAGAGLTLQVNSGWRSAGYQQQLFDEAVAEHGSEEEAARWVATADTSVHVAGDAVNIGPSDAAEWLATHGAGYGLCRVYDNEPWHFELRPDAAGAGCPPTYADPTQDPRLHP